MRYPKERKETVLGRWFFQNVRLKAKTLCASEKAQRRGIAALFRGGATHSDRARASLTLRFERIDGLKRMSQGFHCFSPFLVKTMVANSMGTLVLFFLKSATLKSGTIDEPKPIMGGFKV